MQEALCYIKLAGQSVKCNLCPWNCVLKAGQTGVCKVRTNENGTLYTQVYNQIAAFGIDPIEKKPLYHFYPGRNILSIGGIGCNLHCTFCQNHRISQCFATEFKGFQKITTEKIVIEALKTFQNIGIAYTYNEPFTFFEFMMDTARLAHEKGLKNVAVSNGYINTTPLKELLPFLDALNVDLKAFNDDFYQKQTKGKLEPVLETLKIISKSKAHLEITNLVIPGLNDDKTEFEEMVKWISGELNNTIPLHLSRYYPQYKLNIPPTPIQKMEELYTIAIKYLKHVYLGNVSDEKRSSTFCTSCGHLLISRNRYRIYKDGMDENGNCRICGFRSEIII